MTNDPFKSAKLYYTIGEVARMFDVNTSHIRFWENEFDIIKPKKNKKGNRLFTKQDIDNFHIIFNLVKEKGYTLQGAKQKLKNSMNETQAQAEIVNRLKKIRKTLIDLQEAMDRTDN